MKNSDGEPRMVYAFLKPSNTRDLLFVRQLLEGKPWKFPRKEVSIRWMDFTEALVKVVDSDGSARDTCSANHFKDLIKFAKARSMENAIKTGEDNADEPGEIEVNLLKIHEGYDAFKNLAEENQVTAEKKKEADLLAAKSIMAASLHRYVSTKSDADGGADHDYVLLEGEDATTVGATPEAGLVQKKRVAASSEKKAGNKVDYLALTEWKIISRNELQMEKEKGKIARKEFKKQRLDAEIAERKQIRDDAAAQQIASQEFTSNLVKVMMAGRADALKGKQSGEDGVKEGN